MAVYPPVPDDRGDPACPRLPRLPRPRLARPRLAPWRLQHEAADRALATLDVAIEHINREQLAVIDRLQRAIAERIVRVAKGTLPEAHVRRRDVEVTCLRAELAQVRTVLGACPARLEPPAVDDADPLARVSQRDRE